jgi:hypothetical protein
MEELLILLMVSEGSVHDWLAPWNWQKFMCVAEEAVHLKVGRKERARKRSG